jgi:hypothetical protein
LAIAIACDETYLKENASATLLLEPTVLTWKFVEPV